jgi:myosin heavy subunit
MVQVYAGRQRATQAPHLFAIAEEAFMCVPSKLQAPSRALR